MPAKKIMFFGLLLFFLSGCAPARFWQPQIEGERTQVKTGSDVAGDSKTTSEYYISLRSPQAGQILNSPFLLGGEARLPRDEVFLRVKNPAGDVLIEETTKVKVDPAVAVGAFGILINFRFQSTDSGQVEVFGRDESGAEVAWQTVSVRFDSSGSTAIIGP